MKTYKEIIAEISATYAEVKKAESEMNAKIEERYNTLKPLSLTERIKQKRDNGAYYEEIDKAIADYDAAISDGKLKIKLLENNAKIALFSEVMPAALEVFGKYTGKPYGEKTKSKIEQEIKEKTGCIVYITTRYCNSDNFVILNERYNIECGTEYINGERKPLLVGNRIQAITFEELRPYYINTTYYDDITATISELKRLQNEAYAKAEELKEICSKFNKLSVDGIKSLSERETIYNKILFH